MTMFKYSSSSGESGKSSSSKMLGVQTLHADPASTVDVITIHGLTGHAIETWTRDGVCWPRDLLPQALPVPARVMTFGYDAGRFGGDANLDIEDAALQLISELDRVRAGPQERHRPLVCIAHSLGGLVLKKALIISNNKPSLRHILGSVAGLVFLATPHRGSALASTADKLLRMNHVIPTPHKFIKSLRHNSPELASMGNDFKQIADQRSLPVSTFYELLPTRGRLLCFTEVVVYKESALLNIESEDALGVHVNHHEICKYNSVNDPVFRDLMSRLRLFITRGPIQSNALVFLPWDTTPHFTGRRDLLQQMHEGFYGKGRRIVLLYGDGGMGKTEVALKYSQENKHQYDYVFFMDSSSVRSLEAEFLSLHKNLRLPQDDNREIDTMKQFFRRERSWLVVLDNDDDWLALNQFGFPETQHGHIIITCRRREHTSDPRVNMALRMKALDQKDARDLLFSRAGLDLKSRALWDSSAKTLIKSMGCHPLAVDSAAAYILCSDLTIDEYLEVLKSKKLSRRVLTYRPKSSKYQTSVESILQITLEEIKRNPDTYKLLKLLVWLHRSKTTARFLKRAVSPQPCWGSNGQPSMRRPQDSFIPDDLIELINGPGFMIALKQLKSYALVADDAKFDEEGTASKDTIVLHPLTYSYVREALTADQMIENAIRALSLVVHAYPIVQAGLLDRTNFAFQDIVPQVFQANSNHMYLKERNLDLAGALRNIRNGRESSLSDRTAEMLFEAIRGYGEGKDEVDRLLVGLVKDLLKTSTSTYLLARLWCIRLPLEFYSRGKFTEGCEAADKFVQAVEQHHKWPGLSERDNAQMGFLRHLCVEYRIREKGLSDREVWEKRAAYIDAWHPRDPENPSQLERYAMGMGCRMRGKLAKDFGLFREAYYNLKLFIERYAQRGSREEGWAIGDFGQVILELEDTDEAPEILNDLRTNGTNFGEKLTFPSTSALCEVVSFICSRAVEYRMFERNHITQQDRENVRESDTVFLEINHAASVLRTGRIHAENYNDAEQKLQGLRKKFEKIRANGVSWHDDQIREFSVLAYLAQISHLQQDWEEAQSRWQRTVEYGQSVIREWKSDNFYIDVAKYSLADVQLNAGRDVNAVISELGDTIGRLDEEKETWMLGMGTYWLDYVKRSMGPKLMMEGMRSMREREIKAYEKGL